MCMQAADVAHKAEVSELNETIQRGGVQLKEQEVQIKKLMKSAAEKDQKIQELKDDNEKLAQTNDNYKETERSRRCKTFKEMHGGAAWGQEAGGDRSDQ